MYNLIQLPEDPLFATLKEFRADSNPQKINLGVGFLGDENGRAFVFDSIKKAAQKINFENFNYLPIQGDKKFLEHTVKFFLGKNFDDWDKIAYQQTCGGTQGISLFNQFAIRANLKKLIIGTPTWVNHFGLLKNLEIIKVPHLDENEKINLVGYKQELEKIEKNSILFLQGGGAHNPIGKNFSISQLEELLDLIIEKNLFVFVDCAYFGLGNNKDEDQKFCKWLFDKIPNLAFSVSFSKNASLYKHRTGVFFMKTKEKNIVQSHLQNIIRIDISNPPSFGSEIMNIVFENFYENWLQELENIRQNLNLRRKKLCEELGSKFLSIKDGKGLFGLLPISENQVNLLKKKFSIYLPKSGRINFGGVPINKINFLAEKITEIL